MVDSISGRPQPVVIQPTPTAEVTRPTNVATPAAVTPTDAFQSTPVPAATAPAIGVAKAFDGRVQVPVGTVTMTGSMLDGRPPSWQAQVDLPLAKLNLNGAKIVGVTLGLPWRDEATPDEPLSFSTDGNSMRVFVPNALPSTESWGNKISPMFSVKTSDGRSLLVEATPSALAKDTSADQRRNLQANIATHQQSITDTQASIAKLQTFISDPTRRELAPTTTWVTTTDASGKSKTQTGADFDLDQLARAKAELAAVDGKLTTAKATVQTAFDRADPRQQSAALGMALPKASRGAYFDANNKSVAANAEVTRLQTLSDALKAQGIPTTSVDGELASAKATAAKATAAFGDLQTAARASVSKDDLLAAADLVLGTNQNLTVLSRQRASAASWVDVNQTQVDRDPAQAMAAAKSGLQGQQQRLAAEQAELTDLQNQLAHFTPQVETIAVGAGANVINDVVGPRS